jgi:DDE superfamily endonuclease
MGLAVWGMDEAGPYQAIPQPGVHWQPVGRPARYPHEHVRHGTAKLLTLFHPTTGQVRVKGVTSCPNVVLHAWLEAELSSILDSLPAPIMLPADDNRAAWERWQARLTVKPMLPDELPPLRMLLVMDNLAGHLTARFVVWLFEHGIMPLYTPLSGSWLNMTESVQRIIAGRALAGQTPANSRELIEWLEATARCWNTEPTPFEWGGKRHRRRRRAYLRRHPLGGSGACTRRPLRRRLQFMEQWQLSSQVTH